MASFEDKLRNPIVEVSSPACQTVGSNTPIEAHFVMRARCHAVTAVDRLVDFELFHRWKREVEASKGRVTRLLRLDAKRFEVVASAALCKQKHFFYTKLVQASWIRMVNIRKRGLATYNSTRLPSFDEAKIHDGMLVAIPLLNKPLLVDDDVTLWRAVCAVLVQ